MVCTFAALFVLAVMPIRAKVTATRFAQNPLITVTSSTSLGNNVNGPTLIRVPAWVKHPLGRYYLYFAHHRGEFVRMAYANSLVGPWKIYEPGVQHVRDTAFDRPDKSVSSGLYTHVASPEAYVDNNKKRILLWSHGFWTEGKTPPNPGDPRPWLQQNSYGQFTQVAESEDGIHFKSHTAITKESYLRVFPYGATFMAWRGSAFCCARRIH
jgi:hypothetical protein